jgi:hypothetical protein
LLLVSPGDSLRANATHSIWPRRNGFNPNNLWEHDVILQSGEGTNKISPAGCFAACEARDLQFGYAAIQGNLCRMSIHPLVSLIELMEMLQDAGQTSSLRQHSSMIATATPLVLMTAITTVEVTTTCTCMSTRRASMNQPYLPRLDLGPTMAAIRTFLPIIPSRLSANIVRSSSTSNDQVVSIDVGGNSPTACTSGCLSRGYYWAAMTYSYQCGTSPLKIYLLPLANVTPCTSLRDPSVSIDATRRRAVFDELPRRPQVLLRRS